MITAERIKLYPRAEPDRSSISTTFGTEPRSVSFGADGRAVLTWIAYGACTVGVLLENGDKLETNLADPPGIPGKFLAS